MDYERYFCKHKETSFELLHTIVAWYYVIPSSVRPSVRRSAQMFAGNKSLFFFLLSLFLKIHW